jgi:hypothetical protein
LINSAASVVPGGIAGVIILILLVVALIVGIRLRVGKLARAAGLPVFPDHRQTAADHRRAAEAAEARGDLAEAVRERFRAIVRVLEERGILDERSGRTVDEVARLAAARLPELANSMKSAARLFDDVWYGGRAATVDEYRTLVDLDRTLDGVRL